MCAHVQHDIMYYVPNINTSPLLEKGAAKGKINKVFREKNHSTRLLLLILYITP